MRIQGTGKSEHLVGTGGSDVINGGAGNDIIDGAAGTDYLTGGKGADTFVFHDHSQYDIITDFNAAEGDTIQFAMGGATSGPIYAGALSDGMSFETCGGTCYVNCVDINGDGVMDTQLSFNGDNLFLLGCTPNQLSGADIIGG